MQAWCAHTPADNDDNLIDAESQPRSPLHQVCHTWETEMVEERSPLHVVQKALGHLDPRSTP
jgi:site-specific recombinase XerD